MGTLLKHIISLARCSFSPIPNGMVFVDGRRAKNGMIKHREKVTYGCRQTYTMIGSKTRECDNGRWANNAPVCKGRSINSISAMLTLWIHVWCNRQLRSTHHNRFTELRPRTEAYRNSFYCRTIKEWNSLPNNVLDIEKTSLFQKALRLV